MELQQIADFRAEAEELHTLLAGVAAADWDRPTLFKRWTINDIIQHLHDGDLMALASATDPAAFAARAVNLPAQRAMGPRNFDHPPRLRADQGRVQPLLGSSIIDHCSAQGSEIAGIQRIARARRRRELRQ